MLEQEHAGRTALVTGGSRGIGRAICRTLAHEGAKVAINYLAQRDEAEAARAQILADGGQAEIFHGDISDPQAVTALVRDVEENLGPIDLLVTNAAIAPIAHHSDMTFDAWRDVMSVNIDGTYLPVMAVKDGMLARGFGRIVCISSIAGLSARANAIAYSTSKAAVIGFARSCAQAFAPALRVNCVAPGLIETEMSSTLGESQLEGLRQAAFLKRLGRVEEIANLVSFLLSERSSFTTGQTLVADGGRVTLP